ncbi:MAG: hypothetical protein JWO67_6212 [Streptosporangiaceae bacterium]|jgi:hypothetical protein|nr:hypothetical protein [Streptosporangiaceae bacterium]
MDLEKELREAMAAHVGEASAPTTLVTDVRRRHRRRVTRIRTTVGVAATALVAIAVTPAYNALQIGATPVGAPSTMAGRGHTATRMGSPAPAATAAPQQHVSTGKAEVGGPARPTTASSHHRGDSTGPGVLPIRTWVTYLPGGLKPAGRCEDEKAGDRRTTTCRWTGAGGSVEVHLVRGAGMAKPEDFSAIQAMPRYTSVHGQRAITTERPDAGREIMWIERPGVGVFVSVSAPLHGQLMRVADGIRVPA